MYLPQVVKIILVMNPFVFSQKTVRLIGDILDIQPNTIIELPFEELKHKHRYLCIDNVSLSPQMQY